MLKSKNVSYRIQRFTKNRTMSNIIFSRHWAMPNADTFSIKPIKELLLRYIPEGEGKSPKVIVDPFARNSKWGNITNDLNLDCSTEYHLDAREFVKKILEEKGEGFADIIIFDPVYSPRQLKECYNSVGRKLTSIDTRSDFYTIIKDRLGKMLKKDGLALSFCWNSNGFGKTKGFEIIEIMLVAHGGWHSDTICTVEKKL